MIADPRIDPRLAADIDAAEANKLEAYPDTLGNWTIGRGHLLPLPAPGRSWAGFTILPAVSDRYFLGDLLSALAFAQKLPEWVKMDTQCRQNALVEVCFNMRGKWEKFHDARAAAEAQNWPEMKQQMLYTNGQKTPWYTEVGQRAERITDYFLTGQYP